MGKAAYLSVVEGETITTTGMEKVTKNGSVVKNKASFVVPVNSTVKFYAPSNVGAYAVTNGTDSFALTDNVTASVNPTAGKYYVTYLYSGTIYSTVGTEEGFVTTNHGPITKGVIDMDITPTAVNDGVIAISSSTSNPTWYGQSNLQINFTTDGKIQAYNGSTGLMSETDISYTAGKKYHLHIETNVETSSYSAWITDEDGIKYLLASNYTYRNGVAAAEDLSKLLVIGGWNVEAGLLMAENVVFENVTTKTAKNVVYTINNDDGVYKTWTVLYEDYQTGDVFYDFPAGEFYYEHEGEAYILKSEAEQKYTAADDSITTHNVTFTLVHENAVLKDTFATVDGNEAVNNTENLLFIGSQGVSDIADKDADGVSTVSALCRNMGNPRIPLLTFNVPEAGESQAVKLKVYVAKANDTFFSSSNAVSMRIAAGVANVVVDESVNYDVDNYVNINDIVWADNAISHTGTVTWDTSGQKGVIDQWVTIDVTEYVKNATGDTITFTLYAPKAGGYIADREKAIANGEYMGKAAYLEVVDAKVVETSGALNVTKNGTALKNNESFVVTENDSIRFYSADENVVAFTDGEKVYKVETAVNCSEGYYTPATLGVKTLNGAQVRIGEGVDEEGKITGTESGLRFITQIDKADSLATVDGAEMGVKITAEGSDAVVDIPAKLWQSGDVFTSAITNLAESNYNRKFTATPYVTVDSQTFYGEGVTRSIYQVAAGLLVKDSTDNTEYDENVMASKILYNVLNAYVNQTGIRLSVSSEGLTAYTGTGTSAYSGDCFFEVIGAETIAENVYTITIKPVGEKTIIAPYWQEYIRINNNNSKIKSFTSLTENEDGSVTITFDYASYLNQ